MAVDGRDKWNFDVAVPAFRFKCAMTFSINFSNIVRMRVESAFTTSTFFEVPIFCNYEVIAVDES